MIVKDLELHFEVAYDYNTVMKNVMQEIGATGEECIAIFKDWSSEIFRMYISMSRVNVDGVIDERVVTAKLVK